MSKYYSLDRIKKKKAVYNVIIGERSNGKTYAVLMEGLKTYLKTGGQIAFIRRCYRDWETDRKSTRLNSSHSGESRMPSSA